MPLTDTSIRNAKPGAKPIKLFDERGLFLLVTPTGGKWWRFRFMFDGKEKLLSLGVYPDVSLKDARERRDEARKLVANGVNPSENRKIQKSARTNLIANSFEVIAREWFAKFASTWASNHGNRIIRRFERDIFPRQNDLRSIDFNFAAVVAIVYGLLGGFLARNLYITQDFW